MRFVPQDKSLVNLFPEVGDHFGRHRARVKMWLLANTPWECPGCGDRMGIAHMHEGIISRKQVTGWPEERRVLIHVPYNCVLLCPDCNLGLSGKSPPSREEVLEIKVERFGEQEVARWLRSLPYKVHPLRGWLEGR